MLPRMTDPSTEDPRLDGCDLDFTAGPQTTDDDVDALVMFADVFDDPEAVERRRVELVELSAALDEDGS